MRCVLIAIMVGVAGCATIPPADENEVPTPYDANSSAEYTAPHIPLRAIASTELYRLQEAVEPLDLQVGGKEVVEVFARSSGNRTIFHYEVHAGPEFAAEDPLHFEGPIIENVDVVMSVTLRAITSGRSNISIEYGWEDPYHKNWSECIRFTYFIREST